MKIKKGIILIIIGAVVFGILTNSVSADDPAIREETVEIDSETIISDTTIGLEDEEINRDMDTIIVINTNEEIPIEEQPNWDNNEVIEGDLIISPNQNTEENIILYDSLNGEKVFNVDYKDGSHSASILSIVAGILSSIFIILILKGH